jgi:hypothetical protein
VGGGRDAGWGGGAVKGALGCPWIVREPATLKLSLEPTTRVRGRAGEHGQPGVPRAGQHLIEDDNDAGSDLSGVA